MRRYPPLPMAGPARHDSLSALPSPGARAVAFTGVLLAGLAGGLIGYSLVRIQCEGDCGLPLGLGIFTGAVAAAGGASIVAVLVLRAVGEWREVQAREVQVRGKPFGRR